MKLIFFFISLMSSCIFIAGTGKKNDPPKRKVEPVARWTGTIKREEKATFSNALVVGTSQRYLEVSFSAALPTMNRDDGSTDLNFTDDKGSGSHTMHSDGTNLLTKIKCISDCTGSGTAELHTVIIREWDNTYDIEAIAPACTGKACNEDGSPRPYEEGTETIGVSNEKLTDKDVLSGTKTVTSEMPAGFGTVTATTTWVLRRVKEDDVELIVTPEKYDTWLPEPGKNELTKGSMMTVNLKLQGINGKPLKVKAESFELRLSNTSKEKGITINYPVEPNAKRLPDLRFLMHPGIESIDEDQFITVGSPDGSTGKALIASYDGGGWTTLTVEAILKDKSRVQGRLFVSTGETEIRIPKRDPNSNIAEKWLKENGNPGEKDDIEESPGNTNNGDGLTAYEEYRGVISRRVFKRLDPAKKELGIMVKTKEYPILAGGISLFESATTIKAVVFYETEIGTDRRLNKNAETAHDYDQYVEKLETGDLEEGTVGENQPIDIIAKLPRQAERVVIDISQMSANYINQAKVAKAAGIPMPYTVKDDIDNTIAHELAHGINVNHHGLPTQQSSSQVIVPSNSQFSIYRVFNSFNNEITDRPYPLPGQIGERGNDESGDLSCIMAYTSQYQWAKSTEPDGSVNYHAVKILPVGKTICISGAGKDINANNKFFGNTLNKNYGNCRSQMKLRD